MSANILWLHDLRLTDLAQVGGKNSSLGEMIGNLAKLGVSVPGDVSLVSFDNFAADETDPPLTAVDNPVAGLGIAAVRMLRDLMEGRQTQQPVRLAAHLVVRVSG